MIPSRGGAPPSGDNDENDAECLRLLTADQLAELWQVSSRTIRRMIERKEIPIVRIGRAIRIPAKAVARWIKC